MKNRKKRLELLKNYLQEEYERTKQTIPEFAESNEGVERFLEKIDVAIGFEK
ncbi:MAG: hypothetical protein JKP90_01290 [Desulfofustis sp. PB-SRB1]|nr:hypothetical protein [Desulfofustis sp. PB-SRB1]